MPSGIDRSDVRLLLSILENRAAAVSRAALDDHFPKQAARLLAANLLEQRGEVLAVPSLTDHEDEPVTLSWSPQDRGYGYFSPAARWISIPAERLLTMGVNIPAILLRMMVQFDLASSMGPLELVPDVLWELGARPDSSGGLG